MNQKSDLQGLAQQVEQMEEMSPEVTDKVFEGKMRYKQTQQAVDKLRDHNNVMNMNDPSKALQQNAAALGHSRKGMAAQVGQDGTQGSEQQQVRRQNLHGNPKHVQYSFNDAESPGSFQIKQSNEELDGSLADKLLKEAQDQMIMDYKQRGDSGLGGEGGAEMGTGAFGPSIVAGSSDGAISTEAIQSEIRMLKNREKQVDKFNQVQFGGEFAEIGKLARNIDDVLMDSDLKERGGDELEGRMNAQGTHKYEDTDSKDLQASETPKQRRASAMRRAAGTGAGYVDNEGRGGKTRHNRGDSDDRNQKHQSQSVTMENNGLTQHQNEDSESCYINQSEIQSQSQSQSVMTSERSHFTSIEGPPKVYEDIMRQLEADIRKHIRIEHQLKLHIESVEDRVEELEREQEENQKTLTEASDLKKQIETLKAEVSTKEKTIEKHVEAQNKHDEEILKEIQTNKVYLKQIEEQKKEIQKLMEENSNLQKDLKVAKSQSLRDKESLRKVQEELNNEQQKQKNIGYGPYMQQVMEDNSNMKFHQNFNMSEFGPGSGISGASGVSAVSAANSALSSNNNLTHSQQNLHQFSSLNIQAKQQTQDRLSQSESRRQQAARGDVNDGIHKTREGDKLAGITVNHQAGMHEMPYEPGAQSLLLNPRGQMNVSTNSTNNLKTKSLTEQNTQQKSDLVDLVAVSIHETNNQSKLGAKQSNAQNAKHVVSAENIRLSKEKSQNGKYQSCSPGIMKPTFNMNKTSSSASNTASKSNRVRSKKIQKHQSLEKFSNTTLYGTQVIGAVNQSLIVPGSSGQLQMQTNQPGPFPNGPQVQIKLQQNQAKPEQVFIQNTENLFKHSMSINSNTPDKMKIKKTQISSMNTRTNNKDGKMTSHSNMSQAQQRDFPKKQTQFKGKLVIQQNSAAENIQSSAESLKNQPQQNQSRSHSQLNLYSQQQIQLQPQNKLKIQKGNNVGVIINKQGSSNLLHFQNTSSTGNNTNSSNIKKYTSNAQLNNIYRGTIANNTSGRSDQISSQGGTQPRSKSSKQQFRGNKNQSGSNNIANINQMVSVQPNSQTIAANLDTFYHNGAQPSQTQTNRMSIMQNQKSNSRNSIIKVYNTVGPQMQKQNQAHFSSQKQAQSANVGAPIEQPAKMIRPVSSSKNSRKALAALEQPVSTQIEPIQLFKDELGQNDSVQRRLFHQNLIYIGNQGMHNNAFVTQGATSQKMKKGDQSNLHKMKVNVAGADWQQQQFQVKIIDQKNSLNNLPVNQLQELGLDHLTSQNALEAVAGVQSMGRPENAHKTIASSTGATGGTSTNAAIQRRRTSNQRESQKGSQQFGLSQSNTNMANMTNTSMNSNKSGAKGKSRDSRTIQQKKPDAQATNPLTATLSSKNQSFNNTQKIRQVSTKQPVASGGVIMASSSVVAGGHGNQSTKRSLSKNSQYVPNNTGQQMQKVATNFTQGNMHGGPSPAPKTLAGKLSKMSNPGSSNERHQASSFRQIASGKGPHSGSMTKSSSNIDQQQLQYVKRGDRTSSNPGSNDRQGSNRQRQVQAMKTMTAGGMAQDKNKHDISNLNSLYRSSQQSAGLPRKQASSHGQSQVTTTQNHVQFQSQLGTYQALMSAQAVPAGTTGGEVPSRVQSHSYKQIPQLPSNASVKGSAVNSRLGIHHTSNNS